MKIIEKKRKLRYHVFPYNNKVCYLLLHLALPITSYPPSVKHYKAARNATQSLGIKLSTITIRNDNHKNNISTERYVFHFPYYRREDKLASRFAEAVLIAASITFGPFIGDQGDISCFRIPIGLIKGRKCVYLGELVQSEETRPWEERITEFPTMLISSSHSFADESAELAWRLTPLLFSDEIFLRAFRFLKTSQENFFVWPGQVNDVIDNAHETANNASEQSRLENALQDSFKAIEAILGDPPKNDSKFFRKMESIGIDPNTKFGLNDEPIHQIIRDMNNARDKKAAHGGTPYRTITIGELLVYQECARFVVLKACEYKTGIQV